MTSHIHIVLHNSCYSIYINNIILPFAHASVSSSKHGNFMDYIYLIKTTILVYTLVLFYFYKSNSERGGFSSKGL